MTLATLDRTVEQRLRAFGLLPAEYEHILASLGREPNLVELGMLGAMWSEHCGYKHSRKLLKLLPTTGPRVLQGPGENAGAVDIGDGLAVVLKMESHNHPSAVEPFQGAATGVGGILRDIFTMGARPVALLDSLRFGDPADPRTRYLLGGVIGGIGHYGNCIGVPTVGGEISFHVGYTGNPLVNAMCVGLAPIDRLIRSAASGPGNPLVLVGADTGRDGLQGAAFASNDDPELSHRGVVQVGNPFLEKLLLEACLAVLETGDVLAMQDLGAAGLTSSAVEMAARGGLGVEIDVAGVPRRETGLTPFDVMLSESQERMLLLVRRGAEAAVRNHFAHWDLQAEVVGQVTDDGLIRIRDAAEVVAELPIRLLTDDVPAYDLTFEPPASQLGAAPGGGVLQLLPEGGVEGVSPLGQALLRLLVSPNLRSRKFAYRQYDSTVQGNTVFGPGAAAAAVVRVEGTHKGLALTTDCNPRYMCLDPRRGAMQAVAEAARNLACVGAEPIAVTDCLNFGNPEKPGVAWELTEAIHGLAEACLALNVPIVSGNVSLYNETAGRAIPPTPSVGMVGLLEDVSAAVPSGFEAGSTIVVLGQPPSSLSGAEYTEASFAPTRLSTSQPANDGAAATRLSASQPTAGAFPRFSLDAERRLGTLLRALAAQRLLRSAQDISDGGLAVALAECVLTGTTGATVDRLTPSAVDGSTGATLEALAVALFSEDQGRAVVTCRPEDLQAVLSLADRHGVPAMSIGSTGGDHLNIATSVELTLAALREAWEGAP